MSEDITIDLDANLIDKIAVHSIKRLVENFQEDIETRKNGKATAGFFYANKRKDIAEMKRHLDALRLLLEYYGEDGASE